MASPTPPPGGHQPSQSQPSRPDHHNFVLALFGVILTLVLVIFAPKLPWNVDTPVEIVLLVLLASAASWLLSLLHQWSLTRRRPAKVVLAGLLTLALIAVMMTVAQSPVKAFHRVSCSFGTFGIGLGTVWVMVEAQKENHNMVHRTSIRWGPHRAEVDETLSEPIYLTTQKNDLYSPVAADVVVEPPAYLSCGNGAPPADGTRIDLVGDVWK